MNYNLLHDIVSSLEMYENETSGLGNLEGYRNWLNEKAYRVESPEHLTDKHKIQVNKIDNELCKQVIMLGRYAKSTIKKGLVKYKELVNEDFTYLYRLMDYQSLTKMQLIEKNAHEKQTGLEIIKRLLGHGLIEEFPDPNDGRSKRVLVTEKGKKVFRASMNEVTLTSKILGGNLSKTEKEELLKSLIKLNQFHEMIYHNHRHTEIKKLEVLTA